MKQKVHLRRFLAAFFAAISGSFLPAGVQAADWQLYSGLDIHGSSEPVSLTDMMSGWDSDFQSGTYAYADARFRFGMRFRHWQLERETRWYYYLTFNRATSEFYRELEQGLPGAADRELELEVKGLQARGVRLAHQLDFTSFSITPALAYYRVGHFQFGTLEGVSAAGDPLTASAVLDYHFDQDKILEYPADVSDGSGISMDISFSALLKERWQLDAAFSDLWNRWQFDDAAFTTGCINLSGGGQAVCNSSGAASGRSGQSSYTTDIPWTLNGGVYDTAWQAGLRYFQHDRYQRFSIAKDWTTPLGVLGASLHSTHQLGLHWRSGWHQLEIVSDDARPAYARDVQLRLGLMLDW